MHKIFISPSTQDWNTYYLGNTNEEIEMRHVAELVVNKLQARGYVVGLGGTVSARANAELGNAFMGRDGLYIALHTNAGGGRGTEIWYYTNSTKGRILAAELYSTIAPVTEMADRGMKNSTGYIELHKPLAPAVIVEFEFHDWAGGEEEILSHHEEYAQAVADGAVRAFENIYGPNPITPPPTPPTPSQPPVPTKPQFSGVLKFGSRGHNVRLVQKRLGLKKPTGFFGVWTRAHVKAFQRRHGLKDDGIVGIKTWGAMF